MYLSCGILGWDIPSPQTSLEQTSLDPENEHDVNRFTIYTYWLYMYKKEVTITTQTTPNAKLLQGHIKPYPSKQRTPSHHSCSPSSRAACLRSTAKTEQGM